MEEEEKEGKYTKEEGEEDQGKGERGRIKKRRGKEGSGRGREEEIRKSMNLLSSSFPSPPHFFCFSSSSSFYILPC